MNSRHIVYKEKSDGVSGKFYQEPLQSLRFLRDNLVNILVTWLQRLLYLSVFYGVLAGLWAVMMALFLHFWIMRDYPRLTGEHSLLRLQPGLAVLPQTTTHSTLIRFKWGKMQSFRRYSDSLLAFTQWYEPRLQVLRGGFTENCWEQKRRINFREQRLSCLVNLNFACMCNRPSDFGFSTPNPCFIIKLNRIYGWMPEPIPEIVNTTEAPGVAIQCSGVSPIDTENLGPLCYFDEDSRCNDKNFKCKSDLGIIKNYYYPYLKQNNYQSPFVVVKLMSPKQYVVIMIKCVALARNIRVNSARNEGSIRFEVLIE